MSDQGEIGKKKEEKLFPYLVRFLESELSQEIFSTPFSGTCNNISNRVMKMNFLNI